ncbi:MAG: galactose-1-phosphate uridylyltransferase [Patescibacteria group bacterium]|nr:galactose-1-phosphate uridylyltransferase [Patescibacteria group bacterium]
MIELRKDYILNRWSYIATDRGKRIKQFEKDTITSKASKCFFCPGNENLTPPEIGRMGDSKNWRVRWFPNKFPAVDEKAKSKISTSNKYWRSGEAFGYHEVIAETPDHEKQLADLNENEIKEVLQVYSIRMEDLQKRKDINYVQIFKNSGGEAGTSITHTHTQIIATTIIPRLVQEKIEALKEYEKCPYCDIIKEEEKSKRRIYSDANFVAFAPFAPRFNLETWIFPKKHYKNITELDDKEFESLALAFKKILSKLGKINAPYNFYLHYSPENEDLHFHFEITPRLNKWAGFELATESHIIITSPENTAEFYNN